MTYLSLSASGFQASERVIPIDPIVGEISLLEQSLL